MIVVNDGRYKVRWRPGMTVRDVLKELKFSFPRLVISVNGTIVPRDQWDTYLLQDGDRVKVIHMTAGG